MSSSSSVGPTRDSTEGGPGGSTPARSRCSTSAASPIGSCRRVGRTRSSATRGTSLDISDFPTRHPYVLALWQKDIEVILAGWVDELGVPMLREHDVLGFTQDEAGVEVELSGATTIRAGYLVGCDGGRSVVRKAAGIEFAGFDASRSYLIAEVEMDEAPPIGMRPEGGGIGPVDREKGGSPYGVVLLEAEVEHASDPTLQDLRAALIAAYGTDFGAHSPTRLSRFTDLTRQAASYREGRVLLAGDAAHVHGPVGRPGPQPRRAGRREPGLEAGPGGPGNLAREPPGHLPRRTPPGRGPGAAQHHGPGGAQPHRRPQPGAPRGRARDAAHGRAPQAHRRDDLRPRCPLRPRRGPPTARTADA